MSKKVLGQSIPAVATLTLLYTVPANKETVCSSLLITNQSAATDVVRVSVAIAGAADTAAQYLLYDVDIGGKDVIEVTTGITLATTDLVRVRSANGVCSFNLFGDESNV